MIFRQLFVFIVMLRCMHGLSIFVLRESLSCYWKFVSRTDLFLGMVWMATSRLWTIIDVD